MGVRTTIANILRKFEKPFFTLNLLEISSSAILNNFGILQDIVDDGHVFPVLKSNAYGHGLRQITSILKKREFPYLVVDGYFEALRIWETWERPILLIGYIDPVNYKVMKMKNLALAVWDHETVTALGRLGRPVKVHIKVDTGMHRQGVLVEDLRNLVMRINEFPNIEVEGLMTHFADAESPENSYTNQQLAAFNEAVTIVENIIGKGKIAYIHAGASAGSAKVNQRNVNAIRPGLGLYGYNPLSANDELYKEFEQLRPALTLKSKIATVKDISKGECVSYNCRYTAKNDMRIGVLPLGYYEGIDRRLSNKGVVQIAGEYAPILGRVCMNLTVIGLPEDAGDHFEEVIVISSDPSDENSVKAIAKTCETIPYDILVHLNESIRRVVV